MELSYHYEDIKMKTTVPKLRRIIRGVIQESKMNWDEKINRAKPYIASDASLYYSLRQSGHPFSVAHYSLEPIRTRDQIMDMLDNEQYLQGYKVVGEISNTSAGIITYLLMHSSSYDYGILHVGYDTGSGVMASGFGHDFSTLKDVVRYVVRGKTSDPELDQYIEREYITQV